MTTLSVITNFGCPFNCEYCVVKTNKLRIPRTTLFGLERLGDAIELTQADALSFSGGGDPIHRVNDHRDWWNKVFKIRDHYDIPMSLHTHMLPKCMSSNTLWIFPLFDKICYHVDTMSKVKDVVRFRDSQTIRVVAVATDDFESDDNVAMLVNACAENPSVDQLSFRQMIDDSGNPCHYGEDAIKKWCNRVPSFVHYIEQDDYNFYYAENRIYNKFLEIGK